MDADRVLPPYSYVPGGPWPHPVSGEDGHMRGNAKELAVDICTDDVAKIERFRYACRLFHQGYYWEAHEAWEGLWMAEGRRGPVADTLRGLIKLAAAGVKVRQGQRHGVVTHARRASEVLSLVRALHGRWMRGLDLDGLIHCANQLAENPPDDRGPVDAPVVVVLSFRLVPEGAIVWTDRPASDAGEGNGDG